MSDATNTSDWQVAAALPQLVGHHARADRAWENHHEKPLFRLGKIGTGLRHMLQIDLHA